MRPIRKRLLRLVVATGAMALAAPVAGASAAAVLPPLGVPLAPVGGNVVGGNQIGSSGCVGTNRPSIGGNNGSTSASACGALFSFQGSHVGQLDTVIGPPTLIGSPASQVTESAGSVMGVIP